MRGGGLKLLQQGTWTLLGVGLTVGELELLQQGSWSSLGVG